MTFFVSARCGVRRRWLELGLRRKALLVVCIPIIPLVLMATTYSLSSRSLGRAAMELDRTHLVKGELQRVIGEMSESESAVRGFLLTRDEGWVSDVGAARSRLTKSLERLHMLVLDPPQRSLLQNELSAIAPARLLALERTLERVEHSGEVALADLQGGHDSMARLEAVVARMLARQDALLEQRRARARLLDRWANISAVAGLVVGLVGGLMAAVLLGRGVVTRIGHVVQDAARLRAGEPVSGPEEDERDEIGALRRALKESADLLRAHQQQLERTTAELDSFFTVTPDMLCLAGTDGFFKRLNPSWSALGWSDEQLMSEPYLNFVYPDDRDATTREARALAVGGQVVSFENRYATADGGYRWLSWRAKLDPNTGLIAAIARDITHRKEAEQRLHELNAQLEEATRAKNDFLSRMSHDLRTPLNAVIGFAQLLESDTLAPDQREHVQQILNGSRHLLQLIDEVLQITRVEVGGVPLSTEPIAIPDLVARAVALIQPLAARRQLALTLIHPPEAYHAMADPHRVNEILLNLLSNAVKYNRTGGSISVTVAANADRVRVVVADTGFGIPEAKRARLFTPFDRLDVEAGQVEGTGLGLALAKALAKAMRGDVGVTSTVDVGSTFWLDLPRVEAPVLPPELKTEEAVAQPADAVAGVVLYVDDTRSNLVLVERVLQRRQHIKLLTASRGEDGLLLAKTTRPALILLDLHLPDIAGVDVLFQLKQDPVTRAIPVVIVSADATPTSAERMIADGAAGYLSKPLDIHRLLRLVDEHLAASRASFTCR